MGKKSSAEFGEIILDTEVEDITAPWIELIVDARLDRLNNLDKFCLYLTLYNNFWVENKENYPKWISKVDPKGTFFAVLADIAHNHGEETVDDIEKLFNFWIDFLNENADTFDRIENSSDAYIIAAKRFSTLINSVLSNNE